MYYTETQHRLLGNGGALSLKHLFVVFITSLLNTQGKLNFEVKKSFRSQSVGTKMTAVVHRD